MTWTTKLYHLQTGEFVLELEPSAASWTATLTGRGSATHTIQLFDAGFSQSDIREFSKGNKYAITHQWGDHVAYAGVIQKNRYEMSGGRALVIESKELRSAYFDSRLLYGVTEYTTTLAALSVVNKSHSGATRAVLIANMPNAGWELPIDLPSDGSGGFNAEWMHTERLNVEDHLAQIEADGCEIDFRPYIDGGGFLRWETRVDDKIEGDASAAIDTTGPDSPILDLEVQVDYSNQMTGALGFGKGGAAAQPENAVTVGTLDISVRDVWFEWQDITDSTRLAAATDALLARTINPTEEWSFGLHIFPDGPELAAPGNILNLVVAGDQFIPDDTYPQRVIALKGDMGMIVTPEVQVGN